MTYDIEKNMADFTRLGLKALRLGSTDSGHPTIPLTCTGGEAPPWPGNVDWSQTEVWIPCTPWSIHGAERAA